MQIIRENDEIDRYEETPSNISITAEITVHVKMLARKLSSFLTNFQQAS